MRLATLFPTALVLAGGQPVSGDGAEENCDSAYWLRVQRGLFTSDGELADASTAEQLTPAGEEIEQASLTCGCHVGQFTLSALRLAHAEAGDRQTFLLGGFGLAFRTMEWWPYKDWPLFRTLSLLRRQVRSETPDGAYPVANCVFLQAPGDSHREETVAAAGGALLRAMDSGGSRLAADAASFLAASARDTACPTAIAAAYWALALQMLNASSAEARRLAELGEEAAKSSGVDFMELLVTPWPILDMMAAVEEHLRMKLGRGEERGPAPEVCAPALASEPLAAMPDPLDPVCPTPDRRRLVHGLEGTRVEAIVVFGRRDRFEILHRYLQRNLRSSGGVVDRVNFVVFVALADDLEYLQQVMDQNRDVYVHPQVVGNRLAKIYSICKDPDTIYVKIDDDIVYIADEAIPEMVRERLRDRCSIVSANVVNHAVLSAIHQDIGAVRSFFPVELGGGSAPVTWVRNDDLVPMAPIQKQAQSECVWNRWECAAWMHESFLSRLGDGTSCAYDFGWHDFHAHGFGGTKGDKPLPLAYSRWSINMIAFTAADVAPANLTDLAEDDEHELSFIVPRRLHKRSCAVGRALVAHFTYARQDSGVVENTNLLERYKNLSDELGTLPATSA